MGLVRLPGMKYIPIRVIILRFDNFQKVVKSFKSWHQHRIFHLRFDNFQKVVNSQIMAPTPYFPPLPPILDNPRYNATLDFLCVARHTE